VSSQNALFVRFHADETLSSDRALLVRIKCDQDAEALAELYDRHSGDVHSLLLRITGRAAEAERLSRELFLRIWRRDAEMDGLSPRMWLLTTARKLGLDYVGCEVQAPQLACENGDEQPRQRTALELAYFCGLSYSDIAGIMDVPSAVVRGWVRQELGCAQETREDQLVSTGRQESEIGRTR